MLSLLIFSSVFSQEMQFKVQFSENYATFELLKHLSENYPQNAFKDAFKESQYYNVVKYQSLIKEFDSLNYFYWYEYEQYPYGSKIGGSTYFILGRNLIESKTLKEFKTKSFGVIPNSDLDRLYKILLEFLPVYQEVIFKPSKQKFESQLRDVQQLIDTVDISNAFDKVIQFHNSTWDYSIPFIISLYPIPDSRAKGFTATAFYNQAVGGIPQGLTDFELLLSVMFHEAFHILYDEQSLQAKKDIAQWFENNPSVTSRYAQLLFNEAITTSLANGYLYRDVKGTLLEGDWYNNKYIAQMAKAIFPLVEEYMDSKKQIDKDFVKAYINTFDEKFPNWLTDINQLMMQRFVISESTEAYSTIYKNYRFSNIAEYKNQLNTLTIEEMKTHPVTKIIIVTKENKSKLKLIKNNFDELKNWNPNYQKDFSYAQFLNDKTYLVIFNLTTEDISDLLENVKIQ